MLENVDRKAKDFVFRDSQIRSRFLGNSTLNISKANKDESRPSNSHPPKTSKHLEHNETINKLAQERLKEQEFKETRRNQIIGSSLQKPSFVPNMTTTNAIYFTKQ